MRCPIVCMTCGLSVGDKEVLFRRLRAARVREVLARRGTAAAQASTDASLQIDCSDIFDRLRVRYDCCRKTLATAMDFTDYY